MSAARSGEAVIVLGMHRSGTSATSRVLNRMGSWLGSDAAITRRFEHAGGPGHERVDPAGVRRSLAHAARADRRLDQRPEPARPRAPARAALADLEGHAVFSWKDPRTCFTLPWWERHLAATPIVVYVYRHPAEVAASLATRNEFGPAHALMLWEAYNVAALQAAAGHRVIAVPYSAARRRAGGDRRRAPPRAHGLGAAAHRRSRLGRRRGQLGSPAPPRAAGARPRGRHPEPGRSCGAGCRNCPRCRRRSSRRRSTRCTPTTAELLDARRWSVLLQEEIIARNHLLRSRRALVRLLFHPDEARRPRMA